MVKATPVVGNQNQRQRVLRKRAALRLRRMRRLGVVACERRADGTRHYSMQGTNYHWDVITSRPLTFAGAGAPIARLDWFNAPLI